MCTKKPRLCRFLLRLAASCLSLAGTSLSAGEDSPFMAAYLNIPRMFDADSSIDERERSIEGQLDVFKSSGLRIVMPYVTTTSGSAMYPSKVIPDRVYVDWDPLRVICEGARARGMQVYPVTCVLACGKNQTRGILLEHPQWALRDVDGRPIGHISPCNPQARDWVVSGMQEIVENYQPDGLLLDYLRFNNQPMRLDPHGEAELAKQVAAKSDAAFDQHLQRYKEECLTQLVREISDTVRKQKPGIKLAVYSWGPHVTSNHRVAQDWPTWARARYIDMVNVSGYCYPDNYGKRYLDVLEHRIGGAIEINKQLERPIDVTLCLGIKTSHGQIQKAADVDDYLKVSERLGVDGAAIFTWEYLLPYLDEVKKQGYLREFEDGLVDRP